MTCKDCAYRSLYLCDKHGEIPAERIPMPIQCPEFESLADGEATLKKWLEGTPPATIEHQYIQAMLSAMALIPTKSFDKAVEWLYGLPDSKSVRAVRAAVFVFDTDVPF